MFVLGNDSSNQQWTREQAWHLIRSLAGTKDGVMPYHKVLLSNLFKHDGEATLRALEQAELISITSENGIPHAIKPGKPVYLTVFRRLVDNKTLSSRLNLMTLAQLINTENKSIGQLEEELKLLGSLPKQPRELTSRIQWLLNKVYTSQSKICQYEDESASLQKVLRSER